MAENVQRHIPTRANQQTTFAGGSETTSMQTSGMEKYLYLGGQDDLSKIDAVPAGRLVLLVSGIHQKCQLRRKMQTLVAIRSPFVHPGVLASKLTVRAAAYKRFLIGKCVRSSRHPKLFWASAPHRSVCLDEPILSRRTI